MRVVFHMLRLVVDTAALRPTVRMLSDACPESSGEGSISFVVPPLAATMQLFLGERARLGRCSVRLAPNIRGVGSPKRRVYFERSREPRGRGSLRPRRARSPFPTAWLRL